MQLSSEFTIRELNNMSNYYTTIIRKKKIK